MVLVLRQKINVMLLKTMTETTVMDCEIKFLATHGDGDRRWAGNKLGETNRKVIEQTFSTEC